MVIRRSYISLYCSRLSWASWRGDTTPGCSLPPTPAALAAVELLGG
jgi:hypothetical protein